MVQFDNLKYRRTFKNYFGQFVRIEKKVTSIVAFHFMKHGLKIKGGQFGYSTILFDVVQPHTAFLNRTQFTSDITSMRFIMRAEPHGSVF